MRFSQPRRIWLVAALLALFAAAGANSLVRESATFDETAHLPAGLTYLDRHDLRLNPEHPPLPKAWAALPLWLGDLREPDYSSAGWSDGNQWLFGYEFLNGPRDSRQRADPARLLIPARLMMLIPGLLLGMIVYRWSTEVWGETGGLISLVLYCLSPTMLAHTRLVTTDLPIALGYSALLWAFWRFCRLPGWRRAVLCGLSLAGALLIKFSALLLPPIMALLGLLWITRPGGQRRKRIYWLLALALICCLAAYAGLWAGYGFRYAACEQGYELDWEVVGPSEGAADKLVRRALANRLLPEAYLYGLAYVLGGSERRVAFLNGEESLVGWWYYFPQAFLMKSPPVLILLLCCIGIAALRSGRWRSFPGWFLTLPALFYLAVSIAGNLNIGHRHLVVIYPLLFVLAGSLARFWPSSRRARAAAGVLALGYLLSFALATPRYLSYFNFSAGGAAGGWRYLLDSNIDWGQDLPRLAEWLERNDVERLHLAYFGTADPSAYGISYDKLYMVHDFHPERPRSMPNSGDHVAVSVNLLQGLYYNDDEAFARRLLKGGLISRGEVDEWLGLRNRMSFAGRRHPSIAAWAVERGIIDAEMRRRLERGLLSSWFGRLRDGGKPVARAGDSILIYRLP